MGSGGGLNPGPASSLGDKITLVIDDTRFVLNTSLFTAHPDTMLGMKIPIPVCADSDPGSGAFLNPGSGMGKKIRIRIRDEQPGSYFRELRKIIFWVKIHKFFDADPGSGIEKIRIRDPR